MRKAGRTVGRKQKESKRKRAESGKQCGKEISIEIGKKV
jgi:hypothetical protein